MARNFSAAIDDRGIAEAPTGDGGGGTFDSEDYGGWEQAGIEEVAAGVEDSGVVWVWVAGSDRREEIRNGIEKRDLKIEN